MLSLRERVRESVPNLQYALTFLLPLRRTARRRCDSMSGASGAFDVPPTSRLKQRHAGRCRAASTRTSTRSPSRNLSSELSHYALAGSASECLWAAAASMT